MQCIVVCHSGLKSKAYDDMKIKWFEKLRQICFVYKKLCPFWELFFEGAVWQGAAHMIFGTEIIVQ